jgi:hypothetical protein
MWCLFDSEGVCIRRATEYTALTEWCEKQGMVAPKIEWVRGQSLGKLKSAGPPACVKCDDRGWVYAQVQVAPAAFRMDSATMAGILRKCEEVHGFDREYRSVEASNLLGASGLNQWVADWAFAQGVIKGELAEGRVRCDCPKANHHKRVGVTDAPF